MKQSYNSLLELLAVFNPQHLVAAEVWANLQQTAGKLPPIYHGGLECRLHPNDSRVDLHQSILPDPAETDLLIEHIERCGWMQHTGWQQVVRLCRQWRSPKSSLKRCVSEIWLEFDIRRRSDEIPVPSIFLQLQSPGANGTAPQDLAATVLKALTPQVDSSDVNLLQNALMRCVRSCPANARVTHVGLMLSRRPDLLRINVSGLSMQQWAPFLQKIGWPGSPAALSDLLDPLYSAAEHLNFCVDIGHRTLPGLGFECLVASGSDRKNAWKYFLDQLCARGMCSAEKMAAVLSWEKIIRPPDAPRRWPENLIVESLMRGPDLFSLVSRAINHVKIVYHQSRPPEAKAYLWFGHLWISKDEIRSAFGRRTLNRQAEENDES